MARPKMVSQPQPQLHRHPHLHAQHPTPSLDHPPQQTNIHIPPAVDLPPGVPESHLIDRSLAQSLKCTICFRILSLDIKPTWVCCSPFCKDCFVKHCYRAQEERIKAGLSSSPFPTIAPCVKCGTVVDVENLNWNEARSIGIQEYGDKVAEMRMKCHGASRCEVELRVEEWRDHYQVCDYRPVNCSRKCGKTHPYILPEVHVADCPNVTVSCPWFKECGWTGARHKLMAHSLNCRHNRCRYCDRRDTAPLIKKHERICLPLKKELLELRNRLELEVIKTQKLERELLRLKCGMNFPAVAQFPFSTHWLSHPHATIQAYYVSDPSTPVEPQPYPNANELRKASSSSCPASISAHHSTLPKVHPQRHTQPGRQYPAAASDPKSNYLHPAVAHTLSRQPRLYNQPDSLPLRPSASAAAPGMSRAGSECGFATSVLSEYGDDINSLNGNEVANVPTVIAKRTNSPQQTNSARGSQHSGRISSPVSIRSSSSSSSSASSSASSRNSTTSTGKRTRQEIEDRYDYPNNRGQGSHEEDGGGPGDNHSEASTSDSSNSSNSSERGDEEELPKQPGKKRRVSEDSRVPLTVDGIQGGWVEIKGTKSRG